jgi:hypothetical protein
LAVVKKLTIQIFLVVIDHLDETALTVLGDAFGSLLLGYRFGFGHVRLG